MPNSCKCIIDRMLHKGAMTKEEHDKILRNIPRWIPCSERLPEKNCRCLTTNDAWGAFEVDWNAWIDGQWLYPNEEPVAWMPLPEPYEEEKK